ncbi:MAG: hypothetical protein KAS26_07005 [Sulfurimonas sp.]|nr:hypothetical protein [Sulfurimonas sp.]
MKKLHTIILVFFLNFIFIQTASSEEQFHHVENCGVCHDWTTFGVPGANLVGIRNVIQTPNSGFKEVVFKDRLDTDGNASDFADGDALFNGICEVCHTVNNHHRNNGSDNTEHFDGQRCTACHLHNANSEFAQFAPPVEQAHRTHLDYRGKGPLITDCAVCHTPPIELDPNYQFENGVSQGITFRDDNTLATTTACDNCHSPWGVYPGGDETTALMDSTIGAKANFITGIYESDGYTLKDGKEKWCVTCHDDRPSTSAYDSDPDPAAIVSPQTFEYDDPAIYFTDGDPNGDGDQTGWNDRSGVTYVDHKLAGGNNWGTKFSWMTLDFSVPQDGSYMFLTKWNPDDSSCNTAELGAVFISMTDSSGTTEKSYEQDGVAAEYIEMATFDIVAGSAELNVSKRGVNCGLSVGAIRIEPQGGSGGGSVVFAPMIAGDDKTWGFYATGHGVSGVQCTECHDPRKKHIDYNQRTYDMDSGRFNIINPWGDSYRLKTNDPVPGAALCARCHDMEMIWVTNGEKAVQTNYRGLANLHSYHMALTNLSSQGSDSDWDGLVDSDIRCLNCHNVHGSTKPHMFRDGNLVSSPYTSDKKPMYPHGYEVYTKATWQPVLQGGEYEVFARWPAVAGAATNAPFVIKGSEIFSTTVKVDQTANADTWVSLGTYALSDDNLSRVILHEKETDGTIVADAVRFVSAGETVTVDNTDANYSTLGTVTNVSGSGGFNDDYDTIAAGVTALLDDVLDINTSPTDYGKPLLVEQRNIFMGALGVDIDSWISTNGICRSCHNSDDENSGTSNENNIVPFTGPKILNRFEEKRWVLNDGTEDAEVYVTARDYDSNITSVTLDLTPISGGVVAMNPVGQQLYHYTIPGNMINGLSDISYELSVTAVDTDGQSVTDETYLFPKDGNDTIYIDTNNAEIYNVSFARFAVRKDGQLVNGKIPSIDINYFGPGYRFSAIESEYANMYGIWRPEITTSGKYEVYGFWDDLTGATLSTGELLVGNVKYTAYAANGTHEVIKDQSVVDASGWNYIGTFNFLDDESNYIHQAPDGNVTMVFDAMKFVRVNCEPLLRLSAQQHDKSIRIMDNNNSAVIISAIAKDYDAADTPDTLTYDWSQTDSEILDKLVDEAYNATSWYNSRISFNPNAFAPGIYTIEVTVTDVGGLSVTNKLLLQVPEAYPTLTAVDTDGDGINDNVEGYGDLDEDGVPDYLDNNALNNVIGTGTTVITTEEGLEISIGTTAFTVGSDDGVITTDELNASGDSGVGGLFDESTSVGGLYDFDILGLESIGHSVKVTFLLQDSATIPAGATYKKYDSNTSTWSDFVIDANNAVHSAASTADVCPAPGSDTYSVGLTTGHDCVQLTIQDGGPNDADGLANAEVKDPGGVFGGFIIGGGLVVGGGGGGGSFSLYSLLVLGLFSMGTLLARRK